MARDFSSTIAALLGSGTASLQPVPLPEMRGEDARALAEAGDPEAQSVVAGIYIANALIDRSQAAECADLAIHWARESDLSGCDLGTMRLAEALMYRAGLLGGLGFKQLAERDAEEALGLLEMLADEGSEHAALALSSVTQLMANEGLSVPGYAVEGGR
jgi:hypothetical protein